ncbi:MAG: rhomboid family intramembrane serine protease [Bdellovibrionales bacterium]
MNQGGAQFRSFPFKGMVKKLVIINLVVWIGFQMILGKLVFGVSGDITTTLGLIPALVVQKFHIWQMFTYMFLHSFDVMHILFNMLLLWWIGSELEDLWGSRFFLKYYLVCGVGAAFIYTVGYLIYGLITGNMQALVTPVVGASGAVFGLLLAYGIYFSERTIYFMMIFPMKAKHFVYLLGGIEILWMISGGQGGVANLAHLGGLVSGFAFLMLATRWKRKTKAKSKRSSGPKLRLVVDNDKSDDDGPRYWN